jgi:hypothetical protein
MNLAAPDGSSVRESTFGAPHYYRLSRSQRPGSTEQARREQHDGTEWLEHGSHRDSNQSERQEQKPHEGIGDEGKRPAKNEQQQPNQETSHPTEYEQR